MEGFVMAKRQRWRRTDTDAAEKPNTQQQVRIGVEALTPTTHIYFVRFGGDVI